MATAVKKNGTLVAQRPILNLIEGANVTLTVLDDAAGYGVNVTIAASGGGGGGISDGDKGDIVVTASGATWTIDSGVLTAAGRAIIDDIDAAAQRTTLGLGTAALSATGDFATAAHTHSNVTDGDKGDITITAGAWAIDADVVTLAKMANANANSIIGNNAGAPADPAYLTSAQVTAMLNAFTSALQGLVPASGGGTTNFLRADGTWAAAGGGSGLTHPQVMARGLGG